MQSPNSITKKVWIDEQVRLELLAEHPFARFAAFGESMGAVIVLSAIQFKHPAAS